MQISKYNTEQAFDYENGFSLTSEPYRMGNILAHYELYRKIIDLPGDIIELGVFKGNSLIQFATFRELLENEKSRKIVGFDMFGPFPMENHVKSDAKFVEKWNDQFTSEFLSMEDIYSSLNHKGIQNVELVAGNVLETLQHYIKNNPHTRIAMLHIDTDVYSPCIHALELLYERVVYGGVIIFDDYATIEGETIAVDEFFRNKNQKIQKYSFSHTKPSFIIKSKE